MTGGGYRRLVLPGLLTMALFAALLSGEPALTVFAPDWLPAFDSAFARFILVGGAGLTTAWLVSRIIELALTRRFARSGTRPPRLLFEMIALGLFASTLLWVIWSGSDHSVTGALATSGVLVAVLGFALRGIIADVFYGIALSLENAYRIGDWIETEVGTRGRVVEINWRSTRIETRNQTHVVIPNSRVASGRLTNYSSPQPHYRIDVPITLDFEVPVERAKRILLAALIATPEIRRTPAPDVRVEGYDERGIRYRMRFWLPSFAEEIDCRDAVLASVDRHLRVAGIGMPPLRERIHYRQQDEPPRKSHAMVAALSRVPALAGAAEEDLAQLASITGTVHVAPGNSIGTEGGAVLIVVEGVLRAESEEGTPVLLGPGDLFGALPAGLAAPPPCRTASAVTEAVLLRLAADPLRQILVRKHALARRFVEAAQRAPALRAPLPAERTPVDAMTVEPSALWARLWSGRRSGAASRGDPPLADGPHP